MFSHVRRSPVGRYFTSIQRKEARVFKVNFKVITVYKLDVSKMVVVFLMVRLLTYVQLLDRWNGGRSRCLHSI